MNFTVTISAVNGRCAKYHTFSNTRQALLYKAEEDLRTQKKELELHQLDEDLKIRQGLACIAKFTKKEERKKETYKI